VGTHVDITERKLAEEKVRQSEQRHRTILESATDGFWAYGQTIADHPLA
jgi:PAS domain-containing protein